MKKKAIEYLSKRAYANLIGISEGAVRKAITEGKIFKGWDAEKQKIIRHIADQEYGNIHTVGKATPGVNKVKRVSKIQRAKSTHYNKEEPDKYALLNAKYTGTHVAAENFTKSTQLGTPRGQDLSTLNNGELLSLLKITADMSLQDAIKYNEIIEAALKKKKLEELEDALVRKANVEATLFAFGRQLRNAILSIPSRVIDDILNSNNKVEAINVLTAEITSVLDQYSNFKTIQLTNKI